jgi:uncharacterized repeat protein (TIGR04076 family)
LVEGKDTEIILELKKGGFMEEATKIGYRVVGTIKRVKGSCSAGHKEGDDIELSGHNTGGLCGFLYHQAFPYIIMLQFGGGFPSEWGNPDVVELDCMDKKNAVTIELKRIRD